jgi:membrane protein implicated in regulation of membrane protease activity
MIDYIHSNFSGFWIALGFAMLAAEVLVFGFSTIVFMFAGLGAILTGLLLMTGIIPETWIAATACFGISTGLLSTLLWKPLKKLQDRSPTEQKPQSDIVGMRFYVDQDISVSQPGNYRYSGISWKVLVAPDSEEQSLIKGQQVEVASVDVGIFWVRPVS